MTMSTTRKPLHHYLKLRYPLTILPNPDGGYVIVYPDLPGCVSQAETLQQVPEMAEEARAGWIETEYEEGRSIPDPSDLQKVNSITNCSDCRFWAPIRGRQDAGNCPKFNSSGGFPDDNESLAYAEDMESCRAGIVTKPDFGCVMGQSWWRNPKSA